MLVLFYGIVIDVFIDGFLINFVYSDSGYNEMLYLQILFEFVLKCLLVSYQIFVYQLLKVFCYEGFGCLYNFEFIMFEWYWVGLDYYDLMDEISDLFKVFIGV